MPYLRQRNTILLGIGLFFFRFFLVTTIILVPQSLAIHGFEPDQIGPAVIWTAASFVPLAIVAGFLLLSNVDPRLLLAAGFASMAFASLLNAEMTSAWAAPNYYRTEFLMGFGQCFAFIGLVSAIILQGLFSGGLAKPQRILTFSAFFHTVRLFGERWERSSWGVSLPSARNSTRTCWGCTCSRETGSPTEASGN